MDRIRVAVAGALVCAFAGCSSVGDSDFGVPTDPGIPMPPTTPAPTGTKWKGVESTDDCGHTTLTWIAVDEICEGLEDASDLDALRAPMFRDGVIIDGALFAVDATNLWSLDVSEPSTVTRLDMVSGLGHPLSAAAHAGRLLIASGARGLLVLDVTSASEPTLIHEVGLPGFALNVRVTGDRATVALGKAGVAVVDLTNPPKVLAVHATPSVAAAAVLRDDHVFVAACDRMVVLDASTGSVTGEASIETLSPAGPNRAPAKDITIVGPFAYVAAGSWGALSLNIADPKQPKLVGNCAPLAPDAGFYASGVRANEQTLFIAGGEWGVLPVDLPATGGACQGWALPSPALPTVPKKPGCETAPPWETVDWQVVYQPPPVPPLGKDPIQILLHENQLFAFGDAARIGLRAIDVRSATPKLDYVGRYEEPRLVTGIVARAGRLLVLGTKGGLFGSGAAGLPVAEGPSPEAVRHAVAGVLVDDGRWVVTSSTGVLDIEDGQQTVPLPWNAFATRLTARGKTVWVPTADGLFELDVSTLVGQTWPTNRTANLPVSATAVQDRVVLAAPEWPQAIAFAPSGVQELDAHGAFGAEDVMDANQWRLGVPERLLFATPAGTIVEVASLGGRAGLALHDASTAKLPLPAARYVAGAADATHAVLVTADRSTYRSQMLTLRLSPNPTITENVGFTGVAVGVAIDGGRVFVADADRGVRVYARQGDANAVLGILELGAAP